METKKYVEARASIASPEDLKIYDEIVEACNHNLLRAAYILAWVAIVESLKRKIYRLADDGDARSKILKEKIEENEKNSNSSDKCIFESVTDADIVPKKYKSWHIFGKKDAYMRILICIHQTNRMFVGY